MAIKKIKIENFKCFNGVFELELNKGLNILVGNNETGKSTIVEAIHVALTGMYSGRNIRNELSQYLFNSTVVAEYIQSVNNGTPLPPPNILIEIYFDGSIDPNFEGNGNTDRANGVEGLKFEIVYNQKFDDEYCQLIAQKNMLSMPIEYYDAVWTSFSRQTITIRSIPVKSALIDSSNYRYQNGSDVYISRIVKDLLSPEEVTAVAQAHRNMKDTFIGDASIQAINERISRESSIIDGTVSLSVDLGTKNAWENSLVTQLNDIPFGYDLEIVRMLLSSSSKILMVGDPRQVTYHTHDEAKYKKYSEGKIEDFILEQCKGCQIEIDKKSLNKTFRNEEKICKLANSVFPQFEPCEFEPKNETGHNGVFLVDPGDVDSYLEKYHPVQLRDKISVAVNSQYPSINFGESKGLTFERVLIYPTKPMLNWLLDHTKKLPAQSKSKLYVAITRAMYSVGIVFNNKEKIEIEGICQYRAD